MDELPKKLMSQIGKLSTYIVLRRGFVFQQQVGWNFLGTISIFPNLIFFGKWLKKWLVDDFCQLYFYLSNNRSIFVHGNVQEKVIYTLHQLTPPTHTRSVYVFFKDLEYAQVKNNGKRRTMCLKLKRVVSTRERRYFP